MPTTAPQVIVTATPEGTGTLTIDEETRPLRGDSMQAVVGMALDTIMTEVVKPTGHAVVITATDPSGTHRLNVDVDGTVTAAPAPADVAPADVAPVPEPAAPASPVDVATSSPKAAPEPAAAPVAAAPADPGTGTSEASREPQTRREARLTARDFVQSRPAEKPSPALEGWQGALNRAAFGLFKLGPGPAELTRRQRRNSVQRGIAGHKTIVVIGEKGGVSKTTSTYLLAAVLGRVRGGTILAWDNNEYNGSLGGRAYEAHHDHTARDLLGHIDTFTDHAHQADLVNFVRPQRDNKFDVLASQNVLGNVRVIEEDEFRKMYAALSRFYRLIIVDTGNNSEASTWRAAVESADQLVLTTSVKEDASAKIASLADKLDNEGFSDKLANAVTLVHHTSTKEYPGLEQRIVEHMGARTRALVTLPFEEALDAGGTIEWDNLSAASKEAWLAATAAVIDGLR
jgi:MinD-like ATPase involved in chromosome partitioning or flagellar assembly